MALRPHNYKQQQGATIPFRMKRQGKSQLTWKPRNEDKGDEAEEKLE